jgi:hypothetical protein
MRPVGVKLFNIDLDKYLAGRVAGLAGRAIEFRD